MNEPTKVLIVDDSGIIRRIVKQVLDLDQSLSVVALAINGKEAIEAFKKHSPDIVVMDIEMPVMNGIDAIREIRKFDKTTPIVVFSSIATAGGRPTLDAFSAGANDCVAKPQQCGEFNDAIKKLESELIPALKRQIAQIPTMVASPAAKPKPKGNYIDLKTTSVWPPSLVVVGVSTGGPAALSTFLSQVPEKFSIPILIVQHMPASFTSVLANRLDNSSKLSVKEATHDALIRAGEVAIAPGDFHLRVAKAGKQVLMQLDERPPENSCRPAVDVLFRSAAETFGDRVLAVMLTGMGKDGLIGTQAIKKAGGLMVAQDETSSVVWGMPGEVVRAGLADAVLPLKQIAKALNHVVSPSRATCQS